MIMALTYLFSLILSNPNRKLPLNFIFATAPRALGLVSNNYMFHTNLQEKTNVPLDTFIYCTRHC